MSLTNNALGIGYFKSEDIIVYPTGFRATVEGIPNTSILLSESNVINTCPINSIIIDSFHSNQYILNVHGYKFIFSQDALNGVLNNNFSNTNDFIYARIATRKLDDNTKDVLDNIIQDESVVLDINIGTEVDPEYEFEGLQIISKAESERYLSGKKILSPVLIGYYDDTKSTQKLSLYSNSTAISVQVNNNEASVQLGNNNVKEFKFNNTILVDTNGKINADTAITAKNYQTKTTTKNIGDKFDEIDTTISNMDFSTLTLTQGQTIKTISESDGKINAERQNIQINQEQVNGLPNRLTTIETNLKNETNNRITADDKKLNITGDNGTVEGVSTLINTLTEGTDDPQDEDYYIAQFAGGGNTNTRYYRRKHKSLFNYINSKLGSPKSSNLLDYRQITDTVMQGITFQNNNNGSFSIKGTATGQAYTGISAYSINLVKDVKYSAKLFGSFPSGVTLNFRYEDGSTSKYIGLTDTTFTAPISGKYYPYLQVMGTTAPINVVVQPMIVVGSIKPTTFEPFKGKIINEVDTKFGPGAEFFISAKEDLDNDKFWIAGQYACSESKDAATLSNCPTSYAFKMITEYTISNYSGLVGKWMYRCQTLRDLTGRIWFRTRETGDTGSPMFSDWVEITSIGLRSALWGIGMIGEGNAPLQGYEKSKGTIEERLTRLGFKSGSLDISGGTITENSFTRQGNYIIGTVIADYLSIEGTRHHREESGFPINYFTWEIPISPAQNFISKTQQNIYGSISAGTWYTIWGETKYYNIDIESVYISDNKLYIKSVEERSFIFDYATPSITSIGFNVGYEAKPLNT